jgi:hypothetical protein
MTAHRAVPLDGSQDMWRCEGCGTVFTCAAGYAVCPQQTADQVLHALRTGDGSPASQLADHLAECRKADALVVVDGNADQIIADMIAAGWTLAEGAEVVGGKRIRMMTPPPGVTIRAVTP